MYWLKKLIGAEPTRPAPRTRTRNLDLNAPGTQIAYDEGLIARFVGHHRQLSATVQALRTAAGKNDYASANRYLLEFKIALNGHLLEENVKLYTYLSCCLVDDEQNSELMQAMRQEMGSIGQTVSRFIRRYTETSIHARNITVFVQELDEIVPILARRIRQEEESLYRLYQPPVAFAAA